MSLTIMYVDKSNIDIYIETDFKESSKQFEMGLLTDIKIPDFSTWQKAFKEFIRLYPYLWKEL